MTSEAMAVPAGRRAVRRRRMMPGIVPILVGTLVWVGWVAITEPFAVIGVVLREGVAAGYSTLFVALVAVIGLVGIGIYAVAVTAYVLAMRTMQRAG
jgi:hypothetical protein